MVVIKNLANVVNISQTFIIYSQCLTLFIYLCSQFGMRSRHVYKVWELHNLLAVAYKLWNE